MTSKTRSSRIAGTGSRKNNRRPRQTWSWTSWAGRVDGRSLPLRPTSGQVRAVPASPISVNGLQSGGGPAQRVGPRPPALEEAALGRAPDRPRVSHGHPIEAIIERLRRYFREDNAAPRNDNHLRLRTVLGDPRPRRRMRGMLVRILAAD